MNYRLLKHPDDGDIPSILSVYRLPSVSRFISIDEERYWQYVTSTENVCFFKVFDSNRLVATVHTERFDPIMYMSIVVFPQHQNNGIGTRILNDIQTGKLGLAFEKIQVSIDRKNSASIKLFEAAGFVQTAEDGELLEYEYARSQTPMKGSHYEKSPPV